MSIDYRRSDRKRLNMEQIHDIILPISLELGRKKITIRDLLEWQPGRVVKLDRPAGETVDLRINGKILCKAEVVVMDENFGARVVTLLSPEERLKQL